MTHPRRSRANDRTGDEPLDVYDYAHPRAHRRRRRVPDDLTSWTVTDDWPEDVPVTEAEIRYAVKEELARTVDDVSRRTRLGLGACGGMRCAARCGRIVAEMTGQAPEAGMASALRFLEGASRKRAALLGPEQARQEALNIAVLRAELGAAPHAGRKSFEDPE